MAKISAEQERVYSFLNWLKYQPSIVTGKVGECDAAHLNALHYNAKQRTIQAIGSSHVGYRGVLAVPLEPHLHRPGYKDSYHKVGQEAFFDSHGIPMHVVYSQALLYVAQFFVEMEAIWTKR